MLAVHNEKHEKNLQISLLAVPTMLVLEDRVVQGYSCFEYVCV